MDCRNLRRQLRAGSGHFEKIHDASTGLGPVTKLHKFDGFTDTSVCGPTVVAPMGFVAYTDAIIFDLLLTSKRTFSGAEELAFDLKNQKPAKFVRETTGRGTHPVSGHTVADYLMVGVPLAKSLDPATKTNWKGTGVELDVRVSAEDALATAEKLAMEKFKRSPLPPDSRLWVYRRTRPLGEGLRAFAEISKARGMGAWGSAGGYVFHT